MHIYILILSSQLGNDRIFIYPEIEPIIYRLITEKVIEKNCQLIKIWDTENHIHVLININPVINVSNLIKVIKGNSSFTIANSVCPGTFFKWQSGYGALSVSPREVSRVSKYIADRKLHHKADSAISKWEVLQQEKPSIRTVCMSLAHGFNH